MAINEERIAPAIIQKYVDKYYAINGLGADRFSREALQWFQRRISKDMNPNRDALINQNIYKKRTGNENVIPGRLYYFKYQAEIAGNKEIGLYDQYPMVFMFNSIKNKEGKRVLYGINVHYLLPVQRYNLFMKLMTLKNKVGYDDKTKLKLQWDLIKAVAGTKIAERSVHAYRLDRFLSRLIEIHPIDWAQATFLQLQKWAKPNAEKPYVQSHARKQLRQINKNI